MKENVKKINRRNFLKKMTAVSLGSVIASTYAKADLGDADSAQKKPEIQYPQVPKRKLGKTGVEVPSLALGAFFDTQEKKIVLEKALNWGVYYWDTAHGYIEGKSEIGMGKFIASNPGIREKLFIVSKASDAVREKTPKALAQLAEQRLQASLKRLNTDYIDLYYGIHGMFETTHLSDELRQWADSAKKRGLIRFFGFSTHENMAQCLQTAAKSDWIDAVMTSYNFRLMQNEQMHSAIEACYKAGIGIIAMKTQAKPQEIKTEQDKKLVSRFLGSNYTEGQAKIKTVLEDKRITSACVGMDNVAILTTNVAAVLDRTKLSNIDTDNLTQYANATCRGYCLGCTNICSSALPGINCVSDIMRSLMYHNSYGDRSRAKNLFSQIPANVKSKLSRTDYTLAEALCPQHLPISRLVAEATEKLS